MCPRCGREAALPAPPRTARDIRVRSGVTALVAVALIAVAATGGYFAGRNAASVGAGQAARLVPTLAPETPGPPLSPLDAVAESVMNRIVTVESEGTSVESLGTGWLLDTHGDFVTNAHVVADHLNVRIADTGGHTHVCRIMGLDRDLDIAVLRSVDGYAGTPLPISTHDPTVPAPAVAIASTRATGRGAVTVETITELGVDVPISSADLGPGASATTTLYQGMMVLQGHVQIFPGNSGGPVLDQRGEVVGIVTLASQEGETAFAIPVTRVAAELQTFAARQTPAA